MTLFHRVVVRVLSMVTALWLKIPSLCERCVYRINSTNHKCKTYNEFMLL